MRARRRPSLRARLAFALLVCPACADDEDPPCEQLGTPACSDCAPGTLQWSRTYQGGISTAVGGVGVDACGSAIVAGRMQADRTPGAERAFVAKYGVDGELAWIDISDHALGDQWYAATSDGRRALVAGKRTRRRMYYDEADSDTVIASLSTEGEVLWRHQLDDGQGGSAGAIVWLPSERRIVASGYGEPFWLRVFAADGEIVFEDLDLPESIRGLAAAPAGGFVASTSTHVSRYDGDGTEVQRHNVAGVDRLAVDAHDRVIAKRGDYGTDLVEILSDGTVTDWPSGSADEAVAVQAMAVDDDELVLAGFAEIDERRVPWVRRHDSDRATTWTWSHAGVDEREAEALAITRDGSIVVAGSADVSVLAGGIDNDLWIGGIAR